MPAFVRRHSVALALRSEDTHPEVGSGTCIQIEDRRFICTAAHNISDRESGQISIIHANRPGVERIPIVDLHTQGGCPADDVDLGIIELSTEVGRSLEREFVTLNAIDPTRESFDRGWLFLFGFPSAMVPIHRAQLGTYAFSSISFLTIPVPRDAYPSSADPKFDIVFEYPKTGEIGSEDRSIALPDLPGTSGGSVWYHNPNEPDPLVGP